MVFNHASLAKELKNLFTFSQFFYEEIQQAQILLALTKGNIFKSFPSYVRYYFLTTLEATILQISILHHDIAQALNNVQSMMNKLTAINQKNATLIDAIVSKDIYLLQKLLKAGVNPNYNESKTHLTPLHYVAICNVMGAVPPMIEMGVNCYARNAKGETPLNMAISLGHDQIAKLLYWHMQHQNEEAL
jgi:hypothetical protein